LPPFSLFHFSESYTRRRSRRNPAENRSRALPAEAAERILLAIQGRRMKISTRLPFATAKHFIPAKCHGIAHLIAFGALAFLLVLARPAAAHPVPFGYVDISIEPGAINLTLVVHVFDAAHELGVDPPERLLDPSVLGPRGSELVALLRSRLQITADGRMLTGDAWSAPEPLPDRQSIRLRARYQTGGAPGRITIAATLFPYDPTHQTFLNFYEDGALTSQAILDRNHPQLEYFAGSRQGVFAVIRKFVPAGIHHILIGPDHLLFLVGLLLLGGSVRRLLLVVSSFTLAHSITLSLAALNLVIPPARLIEPAIALSIVYVGVDNLMVGRGRDVRVWIAFAFGFIHGFGFANVLREMNLPSRALGWSLFSFNLGVEIGQLLVVVLVASALMALRLRNEDASRRLALAGSLAVIVIGAFWFVQRVFFPGGIA
jgi:hydrogenase/urease accessory protein HupE